MRPVVVYVDPPWAGRQDDPANARQSVPDIERRVYRDQVELRIGGPPGSPPSRELVAGCSALIVFRYEVTEDLVNSAGPALKVVVRHGAGVENLNVALLRSRGIVALNIPDYCVDEVATHALALALGLERRILAQHETLRNGTFDIYAGGIPRRLNRRTAGIVGLGRIGRAVALRLRAFYGRLLACDPYIGPDLAEGYGATWAELPTLLAQSDLVTLHCPLTPETSRLIGDRELGFMKPDALLINTARGGVIDTTALLRALNTNVIGGAGIDVFSPENPCTDPCWQEILRHPKVLATCHRAFLSAESERSVRERVAESILTVLNGSSPRVGLIE